MSTRGSTKRALSPSPPPPKRAKHAALPANFFTPTTTAAEPDLDAEWDAFQREVAAPTHAATTVITAEPVPANEVQEEGVPEEVADEKSEAQERLLEEFEEMEGLEERVRRLKERREALRVGARDEGTRLEMGRGRPGEETGTGTGSGGEIGEEEDDDDDEEEEEGEEDEDEDEEEFFLRR